MFFFLCSWKSSAVLLSCYCKILSTLFYHFPSPLCSFTFVKWCKNLSNGKSRQQLSVTICHHWLHGFALCPALPALGHLLPSPFQWQETSQKCNETSLIIRLKFVVFTSLEDDLSYIFHFFKSSPGLLSSMLASLSRSVFNCSHKSAYAKFPCQI